MRRFSYRHISVISLFLIITIIGLFLGYLGKVFESKVFLEEGRVFHIYRNQSLSSVIGKLEGIINFPKSFVIYSIKIFKPNLSFQQGEYLLNPGESLSDLIDKFSRGEVLKRKFTIVEGSTIKVVKLLLEREESLNGEIDEKVSEGFLYPKTYYFFAGQDRNELFKKMNKDMLKKLQELRDRDGDNGMTINEIVTLASIVERETRVAEERARVAAVFLNRLKKRMRLQADPTVIYGISEGLGYLDHALTLRDLQSESLYNTYKVIGLPPTAIAIPSIESIEAVLKPMETNDLYFVADKKGGHCFASDLSSHNKNVIRYRSSIDVGCITK